MDKNIIPSFYFNNSQVTNIITSTEIETDIIQNKIEDLLKQLFIDTVTWGLSDWEKIYGLNVDNNSSLNDRRARVKMAMRGQGTFTKEMVKNLCKSFTNGEVEVIENNDYSFIIKFIDIKGIPSNLEYLKKEIEKVKPCHLAYGFSYLYNIWDNLKIYAWRDLATKTWEDIKII